MIFKYFAMAFNCHQGSKVLQACASMYNNRSLASQMPETKKKAENKKEQRKQIVISSGQFFWKTDLNDLLTLQSIAKPPFLPFAFSDFSGLLSRARRRARGRSWEGGPGRRDHGDNISGDPCHRPYPVRDGPHSTRKIAPVKLNHHNLDKEVGIFSW